MRPAAHPCPCLRAYIPCSCACACACAGACVCLCVPVFLCRSRCRCIGTCAACMCICGLVPNDSMCCGTTRCPRACLRQAPTSPKQHVAAWWEINVQEWMTGMMGGACEPRRRNSLKFPEIRPRAVCWQRQLVTCGGTPSQRHLCCTRRPTLLVGVSVRHGAVRAIVAPPRSARARHDAALPRGCAWLTSLPTHSSSSSSSAVPGA